MDQIGSSYVALVDLIICVVVIVLYKSLTSLPPNTRVCRVLAALCGCIIVATIVAISVADLTSNGVFVLLYAGIALAFGLLDWDRHRTKAEVADASPHLDS